MIKAAIFDLDGTLLDRDQSVEIFINSQYDRLNPFVGHIQRKKYVERFTELDNRGYVWKDQVYQQLVDEFAISHIKWEELLQDYVNEFKNHCVPFPSLLEMLEELKGKNIRLGIITNGKGQFQMDNIKALGIEKYFDSILVSEWVGMKKPDPKIFKRALEQLHVSPYQSIFIGDHPVNDVEAAQHAGMKGVWKKDYQWSTVKADFIINDLSELPFLIDSVNKKI